MKRIHILVALVLALSAGGGMLAEGQTSSARFATGIPDHITLTWTGDPATTQTITWRTETSVSSGIVQYQAGEDIAAAAEVQAAPRDFETDLGASRLFTATLSGLSPNTKYVYRVGDGKNWSETHTFSTADPESTEYKFLVFGDSQSGCVEPVYGPWATTVHNAYRANQDARFIVNVGDLVEIGQSGAHWNAWFAAAQGVIDAIPEMAVAGNHETWPLGSDADDATSKMTGPRRPVFWNMQFPLPQNGPGPLKNQVYSFDYGPVHFVVLDSQQEEEGDILTVQQAWLEKDLAASTATWKIAFLHKTPYEIKAARSNEAVKAAFCPLFDRYHVDLVFSGHDHGVARSYPMKDDGPVQKPSQGAIYYVVGRSGRKTYGDLQNKPPFAFFFDPQDQPNYLVVEVMGAGLTVKAVKQDGTLVDEFHIDKRTDVASSPAPTASYRPR